jgi:hypothetical protein
MSGRNNSRTDLTLSERLIAGLLAAFFVLAALAALISFNIERSAFDPETYQQALVSGDFYRQFPSVLGELLAGKIGAGVPAFLQNMSSDQWRNLIGELLPESQLQSMAEETLNQVFAWLNGKNQSPAISLLPLKKSLAGPAGLNAALTIIRSQPDCTILQIAKMLASPGQELCNPPKEMLNLLQPAIQFQLQGIASAIPDSISLFQAFGNTAPAFFVKDIKTIRLLMRLSPILPLAILLGITLIAVRTLKGWLVWWGWPFMLTGLLGMPLASAGAPLFRRVIERWLAGRIPLTLPLEIVTSIRAVADAALHEMLKPALWESLALFIMGLVMISTSVYLTGRDRKKPAVIKIKFK